MTEQELREMSNEDLLADFAGAVIQHSGGCGYDPSIDWGTSKERFVLPETELLRRLEFYEATLASLEGCNKETINLVRGIKEKRDE